MPVNNKITTQLISFARHFDTICSVEDDKINKFVMRLLCHYQQNSDRESTKLMIYTLALYAKEHKKTHLYALLNKVYRIVNYNPLFIALCLFGVAFILDRLYLTEINAYLISLHEYVANINRYFKNNVCMHLSGIIIWLLLYGTYIFSAKKLCLWRLQACETRLYKQEQPRYKPNQALPKLIWLRKTAIDQLLQERLIPILENLPPQYAQASFLTPLVQQFPEMQYTLGTQYQVPESLPTTAMRSKQDFEQLVQAIIHS